MQRSHLLVALTLTFLTASSLAQTPADDPANAGRKQLTDYLNSIAARETAARRETIAKITTRAQAESRQRHVRQTMLSLIGKLPERIPLNPRTTGSTQQEGFRVDKVLFDSQPNFPITALLYVPDAPATTAQFPAIVMAPGHQMTGKAGDVAFASAFARAGFIVLSYDPIGQGERLQYPDPANPGKTLAKAATGEHGEAGLQPTLIGDALARYFLWDGMRAVDYLASLPQVDATRIGAFGCSGGGTMTALLAALDPRIAAAGVACYTTSFDALLSSATGVQDSEQSTPNFIAQGLDFPDWSELAAPRPYAIIATTNDMFPFEGAKSTEAEARRFYSLFAADKDLAFITGPGGHGNLRPILPQILAFFTTHLHPDAAFAKNLPPITDPFDEKANPPRKPGAFPPPQPASLTQVTPTGQLSTSYPNIATVFTLNQIRAGHLAARRSQLAAGSSPKQALTLPQLQKAIREVTQADQPYSRHLPVPSIPLPELVCDTGNFVASGEFVSTGVTIPFATAQNTRHRQPGRIVLTTSSEEAHGTASAQGCGHTSVLAFTPRPSPPGTEETKAPILGDFYLTGLRAQLVGKTILGMRVDDVLRAVDYLASRPDVDPNNITAEASGHLGLVLLHAAVLDPRLKHITITGALASYRALIDAPLPIDAPQDILPGVLLRYDIPDLVRALGPRLTWQNPQTGAENRTMAAKSTKSASE